MRKTNSLIILLGAILILAFIGSRISNHLGSFISGPVESQNLDKFSEIMQYVSTFYVDDVEWNDAMKGAIEGFLSELDPHSVYISSKDAKLNEENFQGRYEGIGIHYDIIDAYLTVISPIPGSPSDKMGLLAGDKIVKINNESAIGISNSDVPKKLKGPKGTSVDISVMRAGMDDLLEFTIIRDDIPIVTINTSFITGDSTGYISLGRFAKITEEEMEESLQELDRQGMKRLVLDLRWNAGGYLDQAVKITSMFLRGRKKVVYTEGRLSDFDEEFYTDTFNHSKVYDLPLVVLINNASASASEIVAGAIQDYDRGLIVGTTSFGKGLVQREFPLNDESKLRLTISKYYTPSGRLIQRPYKNTDREDYYMLVMDSLREKVDQDTSGSRPEYHTSSGRIVYGGGGITPDVVVDYVSLDKSPALSQKFFQKRIFFEVAADYTQKHENIKKSFARFLDLFEVNPALLEELEELALQKNIAFLSDRFDQNSEYYKSRLKAEIARNIWGNEKYYQVLLLHDNQYNEALILFGEIAEMMKPIPANNLVNN